MAANIAKLPCSGPQLHGRARRRRRGAFHFRHDRAHARATPFPPELVSAFAAPASHPTVMTLRTLTDVRELMPHLPQRLPGKDKLALRCGAAQ